MAWSSTARKRDSIFKERRSFSVKTGVEWARGAGKRNLFASTGPFVQVTIRCRTGVIPASPALFTFHAEHHWQDARFAHHRDGCATTLQRSAQHRGHLVPAPLGRTLIKWPWGNAHGV